MACGPPASSESLLCGCMSNIYKEEPLSAWIPEWWLPGTQPSCWLTMDILLKWEIPFILRCRDSGALLYWSIVQPCLIDSQALGYKTIKIKIKMTSHYPLSHPSPLSGATDF